MRNFREKYKKVGFGLEDPEINRTLRCQRHNDQRREKRSEFYGARRDLGQDDSVEMEEERKRTQAAESVANGQRVIQDEAEKINEACLKRLKQLEKWREERNRRRLLERKVAKPVFKVGVVHHRVYSPPITKKEAPSPPTKLCKHKENIPEPPPKKISKATKKRLEIKALVNQQKRENMRSQKKREPVENVPMAPKDHQFKAPSGIDAIPLFGRRALEAAKENVQDLIAGCFPSKTGCSVSVSPLCTLLESSSLPKSQPTETLNKSITEEMDQDCPLIKKPVTPPTAKKIRPKLNLLDVSLSNLNENGSPITRRSTRFSKMIQNGVDQSLIKFSPRASLLSKNTKSSLEEIAKSSLPEEAANTSFNKTLSPEKPPVFYSPFVVASRGKSSARKELKKNRKSIISSEDIPTKDTVMKNLNISIEEEERTAQYYKYLLQQEIDRLNGLCNSWEIVQNDASIPEDIYYLIQAAIGQTQLLINKKFKRFQNLVQDCETGKGEMLVTCKDLQGFWEMTYIEVENCDTRFKKLEELKANNWVDEEALRAEQQRKKKPAVKKSAAVKKKPTGKSSSMRALILAARKKMQDPNEDVEMKIPNIEIQKESEELKANDEEAFRSEEQLTKKSAVKNKLPNIQIQKENNEQEADDSAEKTPTRNSRRISTPASKSLLRKVQLSQTRRLTKSPLITMKINKMCKTPEVHLDDSIVYINSGRTPARSILKSCKEDVAMMAATKSANKVIFKEQPMVVDADSESLDDVKVPTGKRLNFNDSFEQDENKKEDDNDRQINIAKAKTGNKNNSPVDSKSLFKEEMYLNSQGIVSTRLIPIIQDTPTTKKLKRRNSAKREETHNLSTETLTPTTPNSHQRRSLRIRKLHGNKD